MVIFCCCLRKCVWSNLVCLVLLSCGLHCRPRSECLHYLHYTCKTVQMKWAKDSKVFPKNMKHMQKILFSLTYLVQPFKRYGLRFVREFWRPMYLISHQS